MELTLKSERLKIITIILLLAVAVFLTYYFHFILGESIVFTHFFYIPIILATLWWQRKGLIIPIILSVILISSDLLSGNNADLSSDLFRVMMFLIIGVVVTLLSQEISGKEQKLQESEEKFRSVAQSAVDGILTTDDKGKMIFVNEGILKIFGYHEGELEGRYATDLVPETYRKDIQDILKNNQHDDHRLLGRTLESPGLRKDGTEFPMETTIASWVSGGKNYFTGIVRDVSERKMMEAKKNELAAIVESSDDAIIGKNLDGIITSWNQGAQNIYGYSEEEIMGKSMLELIPQNHADEFPKFMEKIAKGEHIEHYETQRLRKNGETIDISLTLSPTRNADGEIDGASSIARDITEKKKTEKALKKSLKDKEMLIGEIHHRVKNNLLIITSLLSLQSQYIKDKESLKIFQESENRARSMAMIHEKLYQSSEAKRIDFTDYIRSLGTELYHTYALDTSLINLDMDLDPGLILDVDTAIPLGLIFNELVTNCLKHAFPESKTGNIKVNFHKKDEDYVMSVEDDGVGLPEDLEIEKADSFGLRLVTALSQQIDAQLIIETANGTSFTLKFKENKV